MNYTEFKTAVKDAVKEYFKGSATVDLESVMRTNSMVKDAIVIRKQDGIKFPMIYVNELYDMYLATGRFDKCVETILETYKRSLLYGIESVPGNWKEAKARIQSRVIYKEWNLERIMQMPYVDYLDLAIVFCVYIGEEQGMTATMPVTWDIMDQWKIDTETLRKAAKENLQKEEFEIATMDSLLNDVIVPGTDSTVGELLSADTCMGEEDSICPLYVITNQCRNHSARAILRKDVLGNFAKKHGGSFFILPSSVHELLFVKDDGEADIDYLKKTVCEINAMPELIEPEERLSDSIYYYNQQKDEVEIVA